MEYSPASHPIPQPPGLLLPRLPLFIHITNLGLILGALIMGLVFSTCAILLRQLYDSTDNRDDQHSELMDMEMGDMNLNHDHHPHSRGSAAPTGYDNWQRSIEEKLMEVVSSFVYRDDEGGELEKWSNSDECVICWEDFKDGEMCRVLPACNHVFHKACVGLWLMEKRVCPLCRVCVQF